VKSCIYGWKIDFKIDFYSSDVWPFKDKPLWNNPSRFPNSFFRGKFSFLFLISDSHDRLFAAPYLWFYAPNKDKNTTVRFSVRKIVLMDVKCITKQHNSSDLWPLKVNRDCIVDKSLKIYIKLIKVIPQFCIAHFYCAHLITYNFIHYTYRLKQISFYDNFMLLRNIFGYIRAKNYVKINVFKKGIQKCS
jgi:hypothetical protein